MSDPQPAARPEAKPRRDPRRRQLVVLGVFLVLVAAFFGVIWLFTRGDPQRAQVGDCLRQSGADSVRIVGCGDTQAEFTVVGRVEDRTQVDASLDACESFAGVTQVYWYGKPGETGTVLCLAPARR